MTDLTQRLSNESMQEQMANAWWKVATTLDQVCPGWQADAKSGADAACAAIRDLAGEKALRQIEAYEDPAVRAINEFTTKLGRPLQMTDYPALAVAITQTYLSSTNQEQST